MSDNKQDSTKKDMVDPFARKKNTNWAKKPDERIENSLSGKISVPLKKPIEAPKVEVPEVKKEPTRVGKSFKLYAPIKKSYEKKVGIYKAKQKIDGANDDYVDEGKYLCYLMAIDEKLQLEKFYKPVGEKGEMLFDMKQFAEHVQKLVK